MGDILSYNNKLIFQKKMTTLIAPFFLGIANDEDQEADSEEEPSSRTPMTTNLTNPLL
jgi:hypothetical protein